MKRLDDLTEEYPSYNTFFEGLKDVYTNFPVIEEVFKDALVKYGIKEDKLQTSIEELKNIGYLRSIKEREASC